MEAAGATFRRHAETRGAGARADAGGRTAVPRRTHHRPRSRLVVRVRCPARLAAQGTEPDCDDGDPRPLQHGRAERSHRGARRGKAGCGRHAGGSRGPRPSLRPRFFPFTPRRKAVAQTLSLRDPVDMENRAHAVIAVCFLAVFTVAGVLIFLWLSSGPGEARLYRIVRSEEHTSELQSPVH